MFWSPVEVKLMPACVRSSGQEESPHEKFRAQAETEGPGS